MLKIRLGNGVELPKDIVDYLTKNPEEIQKLRESMRI